MRWLDIVRLRLRSLFRRASVDRELDEEVQAYYDERLEQALAAGLPPDAARAAAEESIGSLLRLKEQCRDARRLTLVDDLLVDVRYGARLLRRNPLFTISAALVLAIGIGATTTIFTVANGLLLRAPAGVSQPERLVDLFHTEKGSRGDPLISYAGYLAIRQRTLTLDDLYGYQLELTPVSMKTDSGASAERIFGGLVTANYFTVLGLSPAAGRLFAAQDSELAGGSPLIVLSHAFWIRRFHSDPAIVNQTLILNGSPFTVGGVAPDGFLGTGVLAPDVWIPTAMTPIIQPGQSEAWLRLMVGGRLRAGASFAQAAAEIDTIGRSLPRDPGPARSAGRGEPGVQLSGASPIPGSLRLTIAGFLALLLALVSSVLVITCTNVAGILLARATARQREIAVRLAIGAGRGRLVRQLLTETLLLFLLGGAAGLLLARALTSLLLATLPAFPQPVAVSLPLDGRVIAFTLGLSLVAALLSGLAPGLAISKADVVSALKEDAHPPDRLRLRSAFVIAQVAFSILLVVVAGLLARAMDRATLGGQRFDPSGIEVASIDLSLAGYTATTGPAFARALLDRMRLAPGVQAATIAESIPSANQIKGMLNEGVAVPGLTPPPGQPFFTANWTIVEPGFFTTLRLPLLAGRDFDASDREGTQPVVIVPESTARQLWPGKEAVGQYVELQKRTVRGGELTADAPVITRLLVVGVARDVGRGRAEGMMPAVSMYAPLAQRYTPRVMILARSRDGQRLTGEIRALLASIDGNLPIISAQTLDEHLMGPIDTQLRVAASVAATVGLVGVLIAAVGIYGVTAYAVVRRTREIGIRLALGAQRADVVRMVLGQGLRLVAAGAAIGLLFASLAGRLLKGLLFGVPPFDPITYGAAALLFAAVGLAACYFPARHATRIAATDALRCE